MSRPNGIDPRGPRFAAGITATLLAVAVVLGLTGLSAARLSGDASFGWYAYQPLADATYTPSGFILPATPLAARLSDPGFILLAIVTLLFAWGVISPRTAPWGVFYRKFIAPRLTPPTELEDPRPPRFAQGVGLTVSAIGVIMHVLGVPLAVPIAAGVAFAAAFLNVAFNFCLGCQIYLLLQRLKPRAEA